MDWIHCNKCLESPSRESSLMFFTNCGHIYCQKCIDECGEEVQSVRVQATQSSPKTANCVICKKACKALQISQKMKHEMLDYFRTPQQLIDESMKRVKSVIGFQNYHRSLFQKQQKQRLESFQQRYLREQSMLEEERSRYSYNTNQQQRPKTTIGHYGGGDYRQDVSMGMNGTQQNMWPNSSSFNSSISSLNMSSRQMYFPNNSNNSSAILETRLPNKLMGSSKQMSNQKPQVLATFSQRSGRNSAFTSVLGSGRVTKGPVVPRVFLEDSR